MHGRDKNLKHNFSQKISRANPGVNGKTVKWILEKGECGLD